MRKCQLALKKFRHGLDGWLIGFDPSFSMFKTIGIVPCLPADKMTLSDESGSVEQATAATNRCSPYPVYLLLDDHCIH